MRTFRGSNASNGLQPQHRARAQRRVVLVGRAPCPSILEPRSAAASEVGVDVMVDVVVDAADVVAVGDGRRW